MDDFFQIQNNDNLPKCNNCRLNSKETKKKVERKHISSPIIKKDSDVLLILENPSLSKYYDLSLDLLFRKYNINYDKVNGIECILKKDTDFPSPINEVYSCCNTLKTIDLSKYKAIICEGRAVYSIIQNSDLRYYHDFTEITFNQTYFYHNTKKEDKLVRVYPIPSRQECYTFNKDTVSSIDVWERFYFEKQLELVSNHIKEYKEERLDPFELIYLDDPNSFLKEYMDYEGYLAWDIEVSSDCETISIQMFNNFKVICITMSFDGKKAYYLPFDKINNRLLQKFFSNKKGILANGKYDTKCLHLSGIPNLKIEDDIILLHKILNTERVSKGLKSLSWLIGLGGYDRELDIYVNKYKIKNYGDIPEKVLFSYATMDAIATYRLWEYGMELAKLQPEPFNAYREYIIPALEVFKQAELNGVNIDLDSLNKFNLELSKEIEEVSKIIYNYIGYKFNISSLDDLSIALQSKGLPAISLNKKNMYKTGEYELNQWIKLGYEDIAKPLLRFRELSTLRKTFVGSTGKGEEESINIDESFFMTEFDLDSKNKKIDNSHIIDGIVKFICKDNKIHPSYGVAMTDSGRANSNTPNFQNQPKQGQYAKRFRKIYLCEKDYYYGGFDYSGFQLRIAAIFSKDENMLDAFINRGGDLHSATAQIVFARDMTLDDFIANKNKQPYKRYRFEAKAVNFCFVEGTLIKTNKGNIPIQEFVPEINPLDVTLYGGDIRLLDRYGLEKEIKSTFFGYVEKTIEIELENGDIIEVTEDHLFPVLREGKEITVKAIDLLETDEFIDG